MEKKDLTDDEEYDDNILELEDDEGNVEKYLHVGTIEYKGEWYCFFQKAEPETEEEEDEVVMFLLKGEGDEQELLPLEDETLMDEVFAEFCNQYAKNFLRKRRLLPELGKEAVSVSGEGFYGKSGVLSARRLRQSAAEPGVGGF